MAELTETNQKTRWNVIVKVYGEDLLFKRYGLDENDVRSFMESQLKDFYEENCYSILNISKDKTKTANV